MMRGRQIHGVKSPTGRLFLVKSEYFRWGFFLEDHKIITNALKHLLKTYKLDCVFKHHKQQLFSVFADWPEHFYTLSRKKLQH